MNKVPMIANKELYFDGRMVKPEEHFESEEKFVEILTLSKAARRGERQKRQYKRRDMVAEGTESVSES
jgi:hypothetical protein